MPLPLPNLDDRRWSDLVEEGRALIPVYGGEWTDHNVHDPGITLVELFSWIAEMDLFQLNQVPQAHERKFLALVGVSSKPPRPATAIVSFSVDANNVPLTLPAGTECVTNSATSLVFQTVEPVTVLPGDLAAIQTDSGGVFHDLTAAWRRGETVKIYGADPQPGVAVYFGFIQPLPSGMDASIHFTFSGSRTTWEERERILCELEARNRDCRDHRPEKPCRKKPEAAPPAPAPLELPPNPAVRTVWEICAEDGMSGRWLPLDPTKEEVTDNTRAFTLNGSLRIRVPAPMHAGIIGGVKAKLCYVRCRFDAGQYDAAPALLDVAFNSARVEQKAAPDSRMRIALGAVVTGIPPQPGDFITFRLKLDAQGRISKLDFGGGQPGDPSFFVLAYQAAGSAEGLLHVEAAFLGSTDGLPLQTFSLPAAPALTRDFALFTLWDADWTAWARRDDFDASTARATDAVLDTTFGAVSSGDGEHGVVARKDSLAFAFYSATAGDAGNVAAHAIASLHRSPHNRALFKAQWDSVRTQITRVDNPLAAHGGALAESIDQAAWRAIQSIESTDRAVTLAEYEKLALTTPGAQVARAIALADFHDHFPCFKAPGFITVVVVPYLPLGRPSPSPALLNSVFAYLNRRRVIGTRVNITAPQYVGVAVQAQVQVIRGTDKAALQTRIVDRLNQYLSPLTGGEAGTGWPLGRWVFRSEILSVIAEMDGVDHVTNLSFAVDGCPAPCSDVCLPRTGLVAAGNHTIEVIGIV
jgi:hypothetical protein